jgi:hypothetical protein
MDSLDMPFAAKGKQTVVRQPTTSAPTAPIEEKEEAPQKYKFVEKGILTYGNLTTGKGTG